MRQQNICVILFLILLVSIDTCYAASKSKKAKSRGASSSSGSSSSSKSSSSSSGNDNEGSERHAALAEKFRRMPVVPLTDSNFSKFVISRPRDYNAAIMFTALSPKYQCSICQGVDAAFSKLAGYYHNQYDFNSSTIKERIAFFVVDVDGARNVFNDMRFETVPRLFLLPPREKGASKMKMTDFEMDMRSALEGMSSLMDEVERLSGVKISKAIDAKPLLVALCAVAVLLALLISAAAIDLENAWLWYRSKFIWVLVSVVCFSVGVSGSIFCIIRSAPMYGMEYQGVRVFAGAGRDQYLIEGVIVAAWTVGCGIAGVMLFWSTKMPLAPLRHVMVIGSMSVFIVLGIQIWTAYVEKTRWYNLRDTVPEQVWSYFTSSVKKSSGLGKRLLRLSEIWLFDFKDWKSFQGKVQTLVVDYLKRKVLGTTSSTSK